MLTNTFWAIPYHTSEIPYSVFRQFKLLMPLLSELDVIELNVTDMGPKVILSQVWISKWSHG